jgi:iron complex transport system ATP-binding protein
MGRFPHERSFASPSRRNLQVLEDVTQLLGISSLRRRKLPELSGGERQLVLFAQTLVQEAELLLLDEPTAQLDLGHKITLLELLRELNLKNGLTALLNTHELDLAGEYCSKLLMLGKGKILQIGTPEEILTERLIKDVYSVDVVVGENPITGRPHIFLKRSRSPFAERRYV